MSKPSEDRNPTDACLVTPDAVLERIAELRATSEQIRAALDLQLQAARENRAEREENYRKFEEGVAEIQVSMHAFRRSRNKRALRDLAINLLGFICALIGSLGIAMFAWRST